MNCIQNGVRNCDVFMLVYATYNCRDNSKISVCPLVKGDSVICGDDIDD